MSLSRNEKPGSDWGRALRLEVRRARLVKQSQKGSKENTNYNFTKTSCQSDSNSPPNATTARARFLRESLASMPDLL